MANDITLVLLAFGGLLLHFLMKMIELRKTGVNITFHQYFVKNPYSTIYTVVACAVLFLLLWHTPQLTKVTALAIGYVSDSVLNSMIQKEGINVDKA